VRTDQMTGCGEHGSGLTCSVKSTEYNTKLRNY